MEKLTAGDPQRLGAYRLLARLGAGGMGRVYLGRSGRGTTAAVKLVRRELAAQAEFRGRFRQEVALARRVTGAWTAPVLDADTHTDVLWLATGYIPGPTLQTLVSGSSFVLDPREGRGPLPEGAISGLAAGLAHALRDIHAAGLVHGDLKPSNVLVTVEGPRVIDFGIARALETVLKGDLTRTGSFLGSPGFLAPEQVRRDRVTPACDVFCLGAVLAYAATGRLPFGAADTGVQALMFRIVHEEPDLSGFPEGLTPLVQDCLRKDPAARPTTAEILRRLSEAGAGAGGEGWLPPELLAELGQHAVQLLEYENPALPGKPSGVLAQVDPAPWVAPGVHGMPTMIVAAAPPAAPPAARPADGPGRPVSPAAFAPPPRRTAPFAPARQPLPRQYDPAPPNSGPAAPRPAFSLSSVDDLFAPVPPAGPPEVPEAPAAAGRSRRTTVILIAVAAIVTLAVGGSVYAFMGGDGPEDSGKTLAGGAAAATSPGGAVPPADSGTSASPSPTAPDGKGGVPAPYLGTWSGSLTTTDGRSARTLVIRQGAVGDMVLTLTADGPEGGSYHCVFEAPLRSPARAGAPLQLGPSQVTVGKPKSSCTPGSPTDVTIRPDGTLRRSGTDTEPVTYTRKH